MGRRHRPRARQAHCGALQNFLNSKNDEEEPGKFRPSETEPELKSGDTSKQQLVSSGESELILSLEKMLKEAIHLQVDEPEPTDQMLQELDNEVKSNRLWLN